mmetsp:Transcript_20090/g.42027  ORF Transcript_20090/g.42027 Transcript_20090/m.42027 type:complete len:210 (-) Transcript_20090:1794-2423(-)
MKMPPSTVSMGAAPSPVPAPVTKTPPKMEPPEKLLVSVLMEGSLDAGMLVEESTGKIRHVNPAALQLFEAPSREEFFSTVDDCCAFWSHSLQSQKDEDNEDEGEEASAPQSVPKSKGSETEEEPTADQLPWSVVVEQYAKAAENPVRKWTITGTKMRKQQQQQQQQPKRRRHNNTSEQWQQGKQQSNLRGLVFATSHVSIGIFLALWTL